MTNAFDVEAVIDASHGHRAASSRLRAQLGLGVSASVTVVWIVYVTASGQWGRVGDQWASAVTMIFGSFVAGSTPQGGGAVAFPVFTKILEIPSEVARTFSLTIQSVGMTAASIGILINRRSVDLKAIAIAAPSSIVGLFVGYLFLTESDQPFGPSVLPGPYVKVTFTVIVAAMAFVTFLGYRIQLMERRVALPDGNLRVVFLILICAFVGGLASATVGSGADVLIYLATVSMIGLSPRVGIASSVLVMTLVSLVGMMIFAFGDGHLATQLTTDGAEVLNVGGRSVGMVDGAIAFSADEPLPEASRFDLFGLWLAAAPVVAWGAPLGSAVSSRATDRQVVKFVIVLAAAEFISTLVFLDELRTDPALALFGGVILVGTLVILWFVSEHRHRLLNLPPLDVERSHTRGSVDVGPKFKRQLRGIE